MTLGAAFRKPRFHAVSEKDRVTGIESYEIQNSRSSPDILEFISNYRSENIAAAFELDSKIPLEARDEEKAIEVHSITAQSQQSNALIKKSRSSQNVSVQDIKMLEPHLAAFRKLTTENGMQEGSAISSNIPPQLLRLVRFFTFKWVPIKRALLRNPCKNEVGVTSRLSLARELHDKNLIATAEFELLEQVIHSNEFIGTDSSDGASRKRKRVDIVLELKMVFSRIPLDEGNQCSMRHLQATVNDYCHLIREYQSANGDCNECGDLPSRDQVSEWALMSFCGAVVSNGIDEPIGKESLSYQMESQMVVILTHESVTNKDLVKQVKKKIQRLLEPTTIDKLSNLNLLCLARFFSYLDMSVAWLLFGHSICACIQGGHGSGLSSLPKLLATYTTIMSRRDDTDFSFSMLQNEVQRLVFRQGHEHEEIGKNARAIRFLKIVFESTQYLLAGKKEEE